VSAICAVLIVSVAALARLCRVLPQFCRSYYLAGIEEINDFPNTLPSSLTLQAYIALKSGALFQAVALAVSALLTLFM
jgi:hypothetical protein